MGRPHKFRRIADFDLRSQFFRPLGIDEASIAKIFITTDEVEALRLKHYINLKQTEAAEKMGISQTTYSRILNSAIDKVTKAIIEGKGIVIQKFPNAPFPIFSQGNMPQGFTDPSKIMMPQPIIVFDGWGCLDCGYEFSSSTEKNLGAQKPPCPECKSMKTYRLIKKGN